VNPRTLTAKNFDSYAPLARKLACDHLDLLRSLPVALAAVLLRDVIDLDNRFPRERATIESRFTFLESRSGDDRERLLAGFANLDLPRALVDEDWVRYPQKFDEDLSAHLWSSKQIDAFHTTATQFAEAMRKAVPAARPVMPRWTVVVLGPDLRKDNYTLFRKLRPNGVFFGDVRGENGMEEILSALSARSQKSDDPYNHWYIDGAVSGPLQAAVSQCSWNGSAAMREQVLHQVDKVIRSGSAGPEMLRSIMATWQPTAAVSASSDALVDRFILSVYGEGSGTQIFSTTFVQWAARELLRRAEPLSLVARFGPRQRQQGMNEMFAGAAKEMDFAGSLVDADFGAYYTWINLNRLAGADSASFIAWSQAHNQAVAIGPGLPRGTVAPNAVTITQLLGMMNNA
jgi:hypothetical protein